MTGQSYLYRTPSRYPSRTKNRLERWDKKVCASCGKALTDRVNVHYLDYDMLCDVCYERIG